METIDVFCVTYDIANRHLEEFRKPQFVICNVWMFKHRSDTFASD